MNRTKQLLNLMAVLLFFSLPASVYADTTLSSGMVILEAKPVLLSENKAAEAEVKTFGDPTPKLENAPMMRLTGVTISVGGEANLVTKKADFVYVVKNLGDAPRRFRLIQPIAPTDGRELSLGAKAEKTEQFKGDIRVTNVSTATRQAIFRPYLLGATDKEKEKLVLAKYDTDIKITLPLDARLVKSSVPLDRVGAAEYSWKVKGAPVLPPVNLWYTTAAENITAKMETAKGEIVVVSINVKNNSSATAKGLHLLTRVPVGKFEPVKNESDGKFVVEQNVMYIWTDSINSLAGGDSKQLTLKLKNLTNDKFPKIQEVAIHNKDGDLVAVAE